MKTLLVAFAIAATGCPSLASEDCAARVIGFLEEGDIQNLASLFTLADPTTDRQLKSLLVEAGQLSQLKQTNAVALPTSKRFSAYTGNLPPAFLSFAFRMDGRSTVLGPVQVQVHIVPGSVCSVLAIHLHVEPQVRLSSAA